jgi:hypothetical protein
MWLFREERKQRRGRGEKMINRIINGLVVDILYDQRPIHSKSVTLTEHLTSLDLARPLRNGASELDHLDGLI